jgi:hypothetical protein
MSEISILTLGAQTAFITAAGLYIYARERFVAPAAAHPVPVPVDMMAREHAGAEILIQAA